MSLRWGVMGTGAMAARLVEAIRAEGGEVVAVSSASRDRAARFAAAHGIARVHGSHHDLLGEELDVAYVATTHDRHHADALACLAAGVPTLVEKPLTLRRAEAIAVVEEARTTGTFLMEAMWMRFQPGFLELEDRLARGEIGAPVLVQADFGIAAPTDPARRWFSAALGGGSLLDGGIYPLALAVSVLGTPVEAHALADRAATGVDGSMSVAMRHRGGLSSWCCSFVADTGIEAVVGGRQGSLRLHAPFHRAARISRRRGREVLEEVTVAGSEAGHRHQVREVHRCLAEGRSESPRMPLDLSLVLHEWLERLRVEAGLEVG